jgi:hypothetical protein
VPTAAEELDDWWELLDDQRWAQADVAHASSLLRRVFENRGEAREWGRRLQQQIMANYTAEQVVPQLLAALSLPQPHERSCGPWHAAGQSGSWSTRRTS